MNTNYAIVLTTCANEDDSKVIINTLLEKKLAACIQIFPINSFYFWKGEVCNDSEICVLIKCNVCNYEKIEETIKHHHTYELPEIILLPITRGLPGYLNWIDEVTD